MTTKRLEPRVIHKSPVVIRGRRRYYKLNRYIITLFTGKQHIYSPSPKAMTRQDGGIPLDTPPQAVGSFIRDLSDKRDLDKFLGFLNVWLQLFMGFNIFSHVVSN
jgi:hypothetical protein